MSVKKEVGRRSIQVEVEVPGSPEQVWDAIATGPGISSWFCPTEMEERAGGQAVMHMGPGMDATSTLMQWDPPSRFTAEGENFGPGAPRHGVEWIVEARSGDTCIVRVVHSLFTDEDDWNDQLEGIESGWPGFFRILRLYLSRFQGMTGNSFRLMAPAAGTLDEAWAHFTGALGLTGVSEGEAWKPTLSDGPSISGTLETLMTTGQNHALLSLETPSSGIFAPTAFAMGGQTFVGLGLYFYGKDAGEVESVISREQPHWQEWMEKQFPSVTA